MSRKTRTTSLWVTLWAALLLCGSPLWAASTLNFPRLSFEEDFLTGIAIVNPSDQEAVVTFTAYDQSGQLLTGTGITNPATAETIPGNQQLAKLTSDLFGEGLDPSTVAWFQATSPADDLTGFFLFLSVPLPATNFDGADLPPSDSTIVFTQMRLGSGDSTELNIINPNSATADLQLELVRTDTIPVTKSLSIPAMGASRLDAATFFGISEAGPDSFITVTSNVAIAGFELIRFLQGDMIGLNARSGTEQLTHLYFPQMVVLGVAETTLGVINQGTQAVILTITAFQPDGSIYGTENLQSNPVTRALNPGESLVEDVETMFGFSGEETLDGWLQVESTSEAVTGFVSYGTPITGARATVAPASTGQTRAIFSHIVTIEEFFTGVAVLNAGQLATNVRILAITTSGTILGSFSTVLQPGQRISELITTLIPEAANQGGGLIWVKSDLPVHFTSLFGSTKVFANIPPQTAPATYNPDSGLPTFEVNPTLAIVQTSQFKGFQVEGGSGGEVWKVNGLEGGEATTGTITSEGLYAAPSQAPTPRVLTISAEGASQTAGASVDVLDKSALFTSEQIVQSVAFLNSLQRIYTAELAILSTAEQFSSPQLAAPQQEAIDSEVFEVPAPGIPKISLANFPNETISKMISFVASNGQEFLLLAASIAGTVIRLNPTTSESVVVASGLNEPSSLVVDPTSGDLLVAEKDRVTTVPKDQLESGLVALARTGGGGLQPQAVKLFSTDRADGITIDRCTGDVFTSDSPLGVIRQFVAATSEIRVAASGLQQPGQLLSLYRDGVSCPDSFQLLAVEAGSDFLTLIVPGQGLAIPWIEAFASTDLSFVPEGTPFTPEGALLLLTELVQGGEVQAQANGSTSSLQSVKLPRLYTPSPPNQFTRPPAVDVTLPQLISPIDNAAISQNSSAIGCPSDPNKGFGYQIFLDWTTSSSPNGIDTYQLIVRNKRSRTPFLNIFVEGTEFTQTNCNSVVIDGNLNGWEWRVRALDKAGNFSDWTPVGLFRFAACQLSDGSPCVLASDLSVSKIASADFVEPKTVLSYSLLVTNAGPSRATEVTLIDQLPFRVAFVSADPSQGSCSESDGMVGCELGALEKDATAEVQIDVRIRPSAAGATLENSALVGAAEDDPDDSNNLDQVTTRVQAGSGVFSDLSLSKVDSADPLEPGAALIYTLTVRNDGPSAAAGVTLFDRLPQEVTLVSAQASQGACSESNGIVRCDLGVLQMGGSAGVEISVVANSSDVTLINKAFVQSNRDDPDGSNNTAREETVVLGSAGLETNLILSKNGSPNPVEPGGSLSYLLTVTNLGPNTATEVVVQDQLPSGVTLVSVEAQQGVCFETEEQTIACQLGVLSNGATVQIGIEVNVNSSVASTSLFNQAFVEFAGEDIDPEDNFAEVEITVLGNTGLGSDLRLEKEDSPDPVEPGGLLTYTLSVQNTGPDPAAGVLLRDDLSFGVTLVSVDSTQGTCSATERVVACNLGSLANGGIATVEILVQVDPSAAGTALSNTAFVRSSSVDFNDDNNSALQETSVLGSSGLEADLRLTKTASVDPVEPGSVLAYALVVENNGPEVATGVVMVDILPSEVSFVSADASQGNCSQADGAVICSLGVLQPQALMTVQILVQVSSSVTSTTLVNSAFVEGLEPDSNLDNNSAQEETTISGTGQGSDLSLSMTDSPDPVPPGGTLTYSLAVSNAGPASATEVRVIDSLPPEVTLLSAEASQGGCFPSQGFVVCFLGTLPSGTTAGAQIEVMVDSSTAGALFPAEGNVAPAITQTIINSALVQTSGVDFNNDNNFAQVETTILDSNGGGVDLSVSKTDSSDPVEPGASLTYTLTVSNGGPDDASGVTVTDPLPFGVDLVSGQASQGSCSAAGGFVTCDLGSVESGASAGIQINVTIDPTIQVETIVNSVFVDSDQEDSNSDNNFDQEETTVLATSEPLNILTNSLPNGTVNNPYFASLAATGGAPPYTWSVLNGSLPPGLNGDSSGFISGTPSSSGSFPINIGVMDSEGATDNRGFSIFVASASGSPLTIDTVSLPMGTVGIFYSASLAATGGAPPYTWNIFAGSLPPGLSGDSSGFISGTPSSSGSFSLGIEVTDNEGTTDSRAFTIVIDPGGPGLTIDTVSLPMGTVDIFYSASVLASGGTPAYFWSESLPGSLPPGLMLDTTTGLISGTPSISGSFTFDIEVHDSGVEMDTRTFTIVVDPAF